MVKLKVAGIERGLGQAAGGRAERKRHLEGTEMPGSRQEWARHPQRE